MIDTIVLQQSLSAGEIIRVIDPASYGNWSLDLSGFVAPPYYKLGRKGSIKSILNLSNKQLGIYAPKLTFHKGVAHDGFSYNLYIEFSAPKLLFDNNLEELTDNDLDTLCLSLSTFLMNNGINLSANELRHCPVKSVHYGKNVVLTDGVLPDLIIQYLSKANMPLKRREQKTLYPGGGTAFHSATNTRAFCVYDKKKEIHSTNHTKGSIFETDSWCQVSTLNSLNNIEVLRLELRLESKKAIQTEFRKCKIPISYTSPLEELFKTEIAKKLLQSQIMNMEHQILPILKNESGLMQFAELVSSLNPHARPTTIALAITLKTLSNYKSTREIRQMLRTSNQQWSRLMSQMSNINIPPPKTDCLDAIKRQLEEFKPIKLEEIKKSPYNKEGNL